MQNQVETVIQVKNVKKIYKMGTEKIFAVDDVSFDILKGEFCCLLGTSGSGKSTLLNLMAGIEKLSAGQIIIKGKKIHRMNESSLARFRQRYLGFVFQSYNLINSMTALENVEFPLVFKRVKAKKRKSMAKDVLTKVGLENRMAHKPKEMSGGQQQRVGIARAFVAKPEIVFADEPTGNLDTKTTMEVMGLIRNIAKENNQTIVMVTHDKRLAEFADKIIHILDGKIQNIEIRRDVSKSENEVLEQNSEGMNSKPDISPDTESSINSKSDTETKNNAESKSNKEAISNTEGNEETKSDTDAKSSKTAKSSKGAKGSSGRKNSVDTKSNVDIKSSKDTGSKIDKKDNTDTELDIKINLDDIFDMNEKIVYPEKVDTETPLTEDNTGPMSDIASTKE
ncbi:ABC transporter ATP-binding protein [Anaerocolumna aminovalerica]|uniref:ABC transporter ATP-binding protein n=1 Tax=Anaerocolumna aminovalerica TaxID=1527 RepID=UPI002ED35ADC